MKSSPPLVYHEPQPISRQEAEHIFAHGNSADIATALVDITFHDPDWQWLQDKCLSLTDNADASIRQIAITCLGHVARIHGRLDLETVLPVLDSYPLIQRLSPRMRSTTSVCLSKRRWRTSLVHFIGRHNKSLDRSGGSVFRMKLGAVKVE